MSEKKPERVKSDKVEKWQRNIALEARVNTSRVSDVRKGLVSASNVGEIRKQIYQAKKESTKGK